jgi:hypothetical protein
LKRQFFIALILVGGWIFFSAWGSQGHWKINEKAPSSLPPAMSFLSSTWPALLASHSSDADVRKNIDPSEAGKHYINLDSYPEFLQKGRIPENLDSVISLHGSDFVINSGILPWAILSAFDSLESSFARHDWNQSVLYASDLGHYTGDGHQPLHLTINYNGQFTGQTGIHSRYETNLIGDFYDLLVFPFDSAIYIRDLNRFVFDFIYLDYRYTDTILQADIYAKAMAGNTSSKSYYNALWSKCGNSTIRLFKNASLSLASLIYTAWIRSGSPVIYPNSIEFKDISPVTLESNYPNPVSYQTMICFNAFKNDIDVKLKIYDHGGKLLTVIFDENVMAGHHEIIWDAADYNMGFYFLVMTSSNVTSSRKLIVVR